MIEIRTPCRLHFGLLAYSHDDCRQFGGAGVMINRPNITLRAALDDQFTATGPMAERARSFAETFAQQAIQQGLIDQFEGASIQVISAPRAHTGLGSGTQLAMATGKAMAALIGHDDLSAIQIAQLVNRGERSAIGIHGFEHGGLIVEGGKLDPDGISPLLVRHSFPEQWRWVLITPAKLQGISGSRERQAFSKLPPIDQRATAEMCRLVMLGLLPALLDADINDFGQALYQLQLEVGRCFKQAQGGVYAHPLIEQIVAFAREQGVRGVGQSSWGPTLYAVTADEAAATQLTRGIRSQFALADDEIRITSGDNHGYTMRQMTAVSKDQR